MGKKIIDTSVWISLLSSADINHEKAIDVIEKIHIEEVQIYDFLVTEILTVLRCKVSEESCRIFFKLLSDYGKNIIVSAENIYETATVIFFMNSRLSFTDSLILAAANVNKGKVVTFDKELEKAWVRTSSEG